MDVRMLFCDIFDKVRDLAGEQFCCDDENRFGPCHCVRWVELVVVARVLPVVDVVMSAPTVEVCVGRLPACRT